MSFAGRRWTTSAALVVAALALALPTRAQLSFYVDPGSPWPSGWYGAAVANMQTVVNKYNAYGDFGTGSIYVYYDSGIPTAQSGYGGGIGVGGTYPDVRVLLHESSHWLGTGTYSNYWQGPAAGALEQQFDGVGALLNGDSQHYWPYGENYGSESSPINDARHVAMVYALRADFGIGSTAPPSSATTATLSANDPAGTSAFNYPVWSDNHFAQLATAYSTGNFALRTPNGYASWTFGGGSLTVNNRANPNGGLVFNGYGTSGVVSIKNLNLDGGTVTHGQFSQDLFQLSGRVSITANGGTFNAAQGNIQVVAPISGAGSLTKAGPYALTLTNNETYGGATTINAGTLRLGSVASSAEATYSFDNVSGATVVNDGVGGSAMNGTLANGATIVGGGKFGNAVSLANGASVDINNPVVDLGNNASWSVSAWVKTTSAGSTILSKSNGSGWSNGNTIFYLGNGNGAGSGGVPSAVRNSGGFLQGAATSANVINDGGWHQVTYTDANGAFGVYVDGVVQSLSSGNGRITAGDIGSVIRLGVTTDPVAGDGTVNFKGLLDNVQIYAAALTQQQVSSLYRGVAAYGALPTATNVAIAAGAKLDLNGASQQVGSLSGPVGSAVLLGTGGSLTVNSSADSSFAGVVTGSNGSLVKQGAGTLTLGGANSYTGPTTVAGGVLRLAPVASTGAVVSYSFDNVNGATVTNDGGGGATMNGTLAGGATVVSSGKFGNAVSLANGASVNVSNPATDLSNNNAWTVSAWVKTTGAGGTILSKGDGSTWAAGNTIFYLGDGSAAGSGGIPSAVRNSGGFFQGSTGAKVVNDGAWHLITYVDNVGAGAVYVDGISQPLSAGNSTPFASADVGSVIRIGATTDTVAGDGTVNFNGLMDNVQLYTHALTTAQIAALYQSSNPYLGANLGSLPTTTDVAVSAGATLDVNGTVQQVASLTGAAGSSVTLGSGQLIVNSPTSTTFAGVISGAGGSLTKQGAGTLTLSGTNVYTGNTAVNAGRLRVTGHLASPVSVSAGATLDGTGTIDGPVTLTAGGRVVPGVGGVGSLAVGSSATWNSDDADAGAAFTLSATDGGSDQLALAGALLRGSGSQFLVDFTGGEVGQTYTLITFDSTTFAASPASTDFAVAPTSAANGYAGVFAVDGDSLDFTPTSVTVPEPASVGLLAAASIAVCGRRSRRSSSHA